MPNGSKLWRFRYSLNKKSSVLSLGKYPVVSLKRARELREDMREMVRKGIKPSLKSKANFTFSMLVEEYFKFRGEELNPKYVRNNISYLKNYYYPTLEHMGVRQIESDHIKDIVIKMNKKRIYETARRTFRLVNRIFKFGVTMQYMDNNPIRDIDVSLLIPKPKVKNFAHITDKEILGRLLRDIDEYYGDFFVKRALQILPHLFVRPANIRFAEWVEIDFEEKLWIIPAEKMKMDREHIVPLSDRVLEILEEIRGNGSKYLFPSSWSGDRSISENTLNLALKRLGYKDIITSHGFRHTASTFLHENIHIHKIGSDIIEMQLGHVDKNRIRGVYNKALYIEERRELMRWWSGWLESLKKGSR